MFSGLGALAQQFDLVWCPVVRSVLYPGNFILPHLQTYSTMQCNLSVLFCQAPKPLSPDRPCDSHDFYRGRRLLAERHYDDLGLRYTSQGLNLRRVLPPGVTSANLRALSLASSRMDVHSSKRRWREQKRFP